MRERSSHGVAGARGKYAENVVSSVLVLQVCPMFRVGGFGLSSESIVGRKGYFRGKMTNAPLMRRDEHLPWKGLSPAEKVRL